MALEEPSLESTLPSSPDGERITREHQIVPTSEATPILSKGNDSSDKKEDPDDILSRIASEVRAEKKISWKVRGNISGTLRKTGSEVLSQMFPVNNGRKDEVYL